MYNEIFDQKIYIISNQNRDKGRPICIIAYHYISLHIIILYQTKIETRGGPYASLHMKYLIKRITLYESKIETRGSPYVSLHNANKMMRYMCNTLCSVYLSIIPKSITGGHIGTMKAIMKTYQERAPKASHCHLGTMIGILDFLKWSYLSIIMSFYNRPIIALILFHIFHIFHILFHKQLLSSLVYLYGSWNALATACSAMFKNVH